MKRRLVSVMIAAFIVTTLLIGAASASGGMSYTIDSMYLYDPETFLEYTSIPEAPFLVEVEVTNTGSTGNAGVFFAWYSLDGQMLGVKQVDSPEAIYGSTSYFRTTIDNTEGFIGCVKAFVVPRDGSMTPLAEAASIEKDLLCGAISGITVSGRTVSAAVVPEVDCNLVVQILDEDSGAVLWTGEKAVTAGAAMVDFTVDAELPAYFIVTGRLYNAYGAPLNDLYTCLDYTRGYEVFQSKVEGDYAADRVIDVAGVNDGNFIVLAEDVIRLSLTPIREESGTYTFAANADLSALAAGDKICFRNQNGVYTTIRAAAITASGDTVTIAGDDSAKIADLYDVIKINAPVKACPSTENEAAVFCFAAPSSEAPAFHEADNFTGIELGSAISSNIETSFGSLDATLRAGGQVVTYYDPTIWGDDYLRVDVMSRVLVEGDLTIGATGYAWEDDVLLFPEVSLAGLEIIGHIPMKLTGEFEIECEAGMNMHISAEVGTGYTFNTRDGTQKYTYKNIAPSDVSAQGDMEVVVGLRYSVGVSLLNDLVEATIGVGAGVGLEGQIEAATTPTFHSPEYHACDTCLGGRCYGYLNANLNMHYEVSEKIQGDLFNLELLRVEWTIGRIYISLLNDAESIHQGKIVFGWGECPNKKYLVTVVTYNNGQQKEGHPVTILDCDGQTVASGTSTFKTYLYPETYAAEATVETNEVRQDFVVMDSMAVYLYAKDPLLHGTVTDKETSEPLSGVTVMVLKDDEIHTTAIPSNCPAALIRYPLFWRDTKVMSTACPTCRRIRASVLRWRRLRSRAF